MAIHSSILAWKIPWTEELVGYSPWCRKELDMTEHTHNSNHKTDRIIMYYEVPSSDITVDKCVNQHVMRVNLAQCDMSSIFQF